MSVTVQDCLRLPALSNAKVVAGYRGLSAVVKKVSVIEFDHDYHDNFRVDNEIVLTSLYQARGSIEEQCRILEHSKESGDVAMILFYSGVVLRGISMRLLETANRLDFPLIVLPERSMELSYADVIDGIMEAIILDRQAEALTDGGAALAEKIYPQEQSFSFWHLAFADKCRDILRSADSPERRHYQNLLLPLQKSGGELLQTLCIYLIDADGELKKTAALSFQHRNTVIYRLNRAKELLGDDFTRMPFRYELYLALALWRAADRAES